LCDRHLLPDFPYTRASSSFSAAVHLYTRPSQLDTAQVWHRRFRDTPPWCHFGLMRLRARTASLLSARPSWLSVVHIVCNSGDTSSLLEGKTADHIREVFDRVERRLFSDDAGLWQQYRTRYYATWVLHPHNLLVRRWNLNCCHD
ncbi:uncharacterized protein BJ212DRAFT_1333055, partial [Suillus subaureus]